MRDSPGKIQTWDFKWPRKLEVEIPRDLEAICLKAMHRKPADRYATVQELGEELDRFLEGSPVLARSPGVVHRLRLRERSRRPRSPGSASR